MSTESTAPAGPVPAAPTPTRFRFGEADRPTYGEGPHDGWYQIDVWNLDHLEGGVIERFEERELGGTGYTVMGTLPASLAVGYHRAVRALLWLATLANGQDLRWAAFEPDLREVEFAQPQDGPGNPPGPAGNRASRRAAKKTATSASKTPTTSGRSTANPSGRTSRSSRSS